MITRRWAEAGQAHARPPRAWSASTTTSSQRSWTRSPTNWPRAGDRPTDPTSRCSVPGPRRGRRCSQQSAVGRKGLSQVTRELVAPSPYFPPIHSGLSVYFPPIGRTKVRKSLQTLAAPVRRCPWLTRRIPCTGLVFPVVTGASNQCPAMGDTGSIRRTYPCLRAFFRGNSPKIPLISAKLTDVFP